MRRRLVLPNLPLRVLHVTETTVSGVRQHVHNLAIGLSRRGWATGIACPGVRRRCFGDEHFIEELHGHDVAIHLVPMRRELHPPSDLLALARIARLARDYDVVHTHSSKAGFLGRLAAYLAGTPVVVHTPNAFAFLAGHKAGAARLFYALERFAAGFTDVLIACSPSEALAAARFLPPERIRTIPNAVDVEALHANGRHVRERRKEGVTVGMVARLAPQKAPEVFVRAAAHVLRIRPDVRFRLIGDGELRGATEALARTLGVEHAVEFLGHRRDVPALLAALDLFVLTSRYEGLPYSVLEAMACGLPVVATRAPGTVDLVEEGVTGLLAPIGEPEAIAGAILDLLADTCRARALGDAGRRRVAQQFSLSAMLAAHEALYRELAFGRQPSIVTGSPSSVRYRTTASQMRK